VRTGIEAFQHQADLGLAAFAEGFVERLDQRQRIFADEKGAEIEGEEKQRHFLGEPV
jgi:hypothetical protein